MTNVITTGISGLGASHKSLLMAAIMGMFKTFPASYFSSQIPKERRPVNIHPMITSSDAAIAAWNDKVQRRNRRMRK